MSRDRSAGAKDHGLGLPLVSVIVLCRNEAGFIGHCLESIVTGEYPRDRIEVLVVDGMSEDGTAEIVRDYAARHPVVRLLSNPKRITPVALNIGLESAKGDVIIVMGAHAQYPPRYVATCVEYLRETGADVVGGPWITRPGADTMVAKAIALAMSHPFGVGNSKFRTSQRAGYVDTVPFGAYRREVFARVGVFDERLVRNQDNELTSRVIRSGGRIYMTPELTASYYSRPGMRALLKQAARTGMWNVLTVRITPGAFRWRHFVPLLFVGALLACGVGSLVSSAMLLLLASLVGAYGAAAGLASLQVGMRHGIRYAAVLPVVFFLFHVSYGLGTMGGLIRLVSTAWDGQAKAQEGRQAGAGGGDRAG